MKHLHNLGFHKVLNHFFGLNDEFSGLALKCEKTCFCLKNGNSTFLITHIVHPVLQKELQLNIPFLRIN